MHGPTITGLWCLRTHRNNVVCSKAAGVLNLRREVPALSQRLERAAGSTVEGADFSTQHLQQTGTQHAGITTFTGTSHCTSMHVERCLKGSGRITLPGLTLVTKVRVSAFTLRLTMLFSTPVTGSCRTRLPPLIVVCTAAYAAQSLYCHAAHACWVVLAGA